jgi:hypothetical protein
LTVWSTSDLTIAYTLSPLHPPLPTPPQNPPSHVLWCSRLTLVVLSSGWSDSKEPGWVAITQPNAATVLSAASTSTRSPAHSCCSPSLRCFWPAAWCEGWTAAGVRSALGLLLGVQLGAFSGCACSRSATAPATASSNRHAGGTERVRRGVRPPQVGWLQLRFPSITCLSCRCTRSEVVVVTYSSA